MSAAQLGLGFLKIRIFCFDTIYEISREMTFSVHYYEKKRVPKSKKSSFTNKEIMFQQYNKINIDYLEKK